MILRNFQPCCTLVRAFSSAAAGPIGFVGLGNMGAHMARNLVKAGHEVHVFDVNPDAVAALEQAGGTGAKSPRDLARACSTIITMLPSSPHVRQVYCDEESGILANLGQKQALLIDSSTIDPGTAFERAKVLLDVMGKNVVHCGNAGTGQVAKVCNNLVLGISMAAVSEGMNLGVKLGMDPKLLAGVMNTSSGRCWSSDTYNPCPGVLENVPASRGYEGGFGVDLLRKDLGLAKMAAQQSGAALPMGEATMALYDGLSEDGAGKRDFGALYEYYNLDKLK